MIDRLFSTILSNIWHIWLWSQHQKKIRICLILSSNIILYIAWWRKNNTFFDKSPSNQEKIKIHNWIEMVNSKAKMQTTAVQIFTKYLQHFSTFEKDYFTRNWSLMYSLYATFNIVLLKYHIINAKIQGRYLILVRGQ